MQLENHSLTIRTKHVSVSELSIATLTSFVRTSCVEQHVFKYRGVLYHLYYIIVTPVVVALWRDEYLIICTWQLHERYDLFPLSFKTLTGMHNILLANNTNDKQKAGISYLI